MSSTHRQFIKRVILRGIPAPHDPILFYLFYSFYYLQVLATGKPGHLTNKVRKFGTHYDETLFLSVFCVK